MSKTAAPQGMPKEHKEALDRIYALIQERGFTFTETQSLTNIITLAVDSLELEKTQKVVIDAANLMGELQGRDKQTAAGILLHASKTSDLSKSILTLYEIIDIFKAADMDNVFAKTALGILADKINKSIERTAMSNIHIE